MSLIVGTDAYCTVAAADTYHANMGNTDWPTATSDEAIIAKKEIALRRATAFLDTIARGKWKGVKASQTQKLAWPRSYVVDEDGYEIDEAAIPQQIADATCEAALRLYDGEELIEDVTPAVQSESVAGAVSVSYFQNTDNVTVYRKIYLMLKGLVNGTIGGAENSGSTAVAR